MLLDTFGTIDTIDSIDSVDSVDSMDNFDTNDTIDIRLWFILMKSSTVLSTLSIGLNC